MCHVIDVWVLTTGLNAGVSKLIGQGVHRHKLLNESASNPILLGITSWGAITDYTRSLLKSQVWRAVEIDQNVLTFTLKSKAFKRNSERQSTIMDSARIAVHLKKDV